MSRCSFDNSKNTVSVLKIADEVRVQGRPTSRVSVSKLGAASGMSLRVDMSANNVHRVLLSGWSRSKHVTGVKDADYAVTADVEFADGTHSYGNRIMFSVGTHDWEFRSKVIDQKKAIASIR